MGIILNNIRRIGKAQLNTCVFTKSEDNAQDDHISEQNQKLHLSMLLSNGTKSAVKIVFNTTEGYCMLRTEIWGATERLVLPKEGRDIPMESIASVSL